MGELDPRHAVYAGSFDPLTLGHLDIIRRGAALFDKLTVGIGSNPDKRPLFSLEERESTARKVLAPLKNVKVLDLYYAEAVTDLGIAHLKHWRNLEYLNVRGTKVTSSLFEHIAKMSRLTFLDVGHSRVNDDLFEMLDELLLQSLELANREN